MSCGVNYQFSLVPKPKAAELVREDMELIGTPHDAEQQGAADPRRSDTSVAPLPDDSARGRRARER